MQASPVKVFVPESPSQPIVSAGGWIVFGLAFCWTAIVMLLHCVMHWRMRDPVWPGGEPVEYLVHAMPFFVVPAVLGGTVSGLFARWTWAAFAYDTTREIWRSSVVLMAATILRFMALSLLNVFLYYVLMRLPGSGMAGIYSKFVVFTILTFPCGLATGFMLYLLVKK